MLNTVDATRQKTVIGSLKLYKVVYIDEMDSSILKDPHIAGEKYVVGEEVFRPIKIVSDGYDTFVQTGLIAFDTASHAWDYIDLWNRHYPSVYKGFTVIELSLTDNAPYYKGYEFQDGETIKVYAVESFTVERIVERS